MNGNRPLALVFGGSRGIGSACVEALARDGMDVAFTYASQSAAAHDLEKTAGTHGAVLRGYRVDIRDAAAVDAVYAKVKADFGRAANAVIANAGINVPPAPVA